MEKGVSVIRIINSKEGIIMDNLIYIKRDNE